MEKEYTDVVFYKVDVDENDVSISFSTVYNYITMCLTLCVCVLQETAEAAGIQAMPTFILYKNGLKVRTCIYAHVFFNNTVAQTGHPCALCYITLIVDCVVGKYMYISWGWY